MAVVNSPYIGIARGRLGEGVFSRVKGQTTVRGYNPSPANPRSSLQQSQRSVFSSAVRFFSRGVQNFFKFAFENKSERESDYNAFMRLNANRGIYFGPEQNANDAYPAVGRFVMTKGSLPSPDYEINSEGEPKAVFHHPAISSSQPTTLGQLSTRLVAAGYQQGDIVTFCGISSDWIAGDSSEPALYGDAAPAWDIKQFTIDTSSSASLSSLGITVIDSSTTSIAITMINNIGSETVGAFVVCVSRPSNAGLKVSTSVLWLNFTAQRVLIYGQSPEWKALVLQAWRVQDLSVLQGSRSVNKIASTKVDIVADVDLPATISEGTGFDVFFSSPVTLAEVAAHVILVTRDGEELTGTASSGWVAWSWGDDDGTARLTLDASDPTEGRIEVLQGDADLELAAIIWS